MFPHDVLWQAVLSEIDQIYLDFQRFIPENTLSDMLISEERRSELEHFGLALYVRNRYLLSDCRLYLLFKQMNINHPDDMSDIVMERFREIAQARLPIE